MPAVDADTLAVVQSVTARTAFTGYTLTRRNVRVLPFQFYRGAAAIQLPEGSTGQLTLKKSGDFPGQALARALEWTREGEGANAIYYFTLDLRTDEMEEEFAVEETDPVTPEPDLISDLVLTLDFIETGRPQTTVRMAVEVLNRYLQPDEDATLPADPDMPAAATILIKGAQTLTAPEKAQVQTNLGLVPGVDVVDVADIGQADGVAGLDSGGKVPTAQLPDSVVGQLEYQGGWNATTDSPALPAAAAGNKGHYYVVTVAGDDTNDPDAAGRTFEPGDWLVSNGTTWDKIDNTEPVATESLAGISRRATEAEAIAGTEAAAHLTPEKLSAVDRSYQSRVNLLLCGY